MVGHVSPEAALGGPIAALQEGDIITFDINARRLDVELSDTEIAERMSNWVEPVPLYTSWSLCEVCSTGFIGLRRSYNATSWIGEKGSIGPVLNPAYNSFSCEGIRLRPGKKEQNLGNIFWFCHLLKSG